MKMYKIMIVLSIMLIILNCKTIVYIPQYKPVYVEKETEITDQKVMSELSYRDKYIKLLIDCLKKVTSFRPLKGGN